MSDPSGWREMTAKEIEEQDQMIRARRAFVNSVRKSMGLPVAPEEIAAAMIRRNAGIVDEAIK